MRVPALSLLLLTAGCASQSTLPRSATRATRPARGPLGIQRHLRQAQRMLINVDVRDEDLAEVCERIGALVGVNVLVDPHVDARVTADLRGKHWREAVGVLAGRTGCEVAQRCSALILYRVARVQAVGTSSARALLLDVARQARRTIVLPPHADAFDRPVALTLEAPPGEALQAVLDAADLPYTVVWGDPVRLKRKPPTPLRGELIELAR